MKKRSILLISLLAIGIAGCQTAETTTGNKTETTNVTAEQKEKLTNEAVEERSAQALKILQKLAATGGDSESQKELSSLLKDLRNFEYHDDANGKYMQSLLRSLEALESYGKGKADEKALGEVYPDYVSAAQRLKADAPAIEFQSTITIRMVLCSCRSI